MKSYISATIEENLVNKAKKYSKSENRSFSNVLELALLKFFEQKNQTSIVTSSTAFIDKFNRADTYERD